MIQKKIILLGIFDALFKSFKLFFILLLPILYASNNIDAIQLGYLGSLTIVWIIVTK